jgi:murein L,D-transpeptidase YcbB/YkuD
MRKAAIVVFAALAGTSLPALAQSEPADAGAALLAPGSLTTELPIGFQQNSNSKLQALIPGDLSRFVDRKPEQTAVEAFYQGRNYQPIWTGSAEALKRAEGAIAFLRNVRSEGLDPRLSTPDFRNLARSRRQSRAAAHRLDPALCGTPPPGA